MLNWVFEAGIFDGLGGALLDLFGDAGFTDAFAGAAAEMRWGGTFAEFFPAATDYAVDYLIWRDVLGHTGNYRSFRERSEDATKTTIETIRDVLKGHGFVLRQLRAHQETGGVASLLREYEALGTQLPPEDLLNRAHKALSKLLHPDQNPGKPEVAELMAQLNAARDTLNEASKRAEYEKVLQSHPRKIAEWFEKLATGKWEETMEDIYRKGQKRIASMVEMPEGKFDRWFKELHPVGKGALVFGVVSSVALGVYFLAKAADRKMKPKPSWQEQEEVRAASAEPITALG